MTTFKLSHDFRPSLEDFKNRYFDSLLMALSLIFFSFEASFCAKCTVGSAVSMLLVGSMEDLTAKPDVACGQPKR